MTRSQMIEDAVKKLIGTSDVEYEQNDYVTVTVGKDEWHALRSALAQPAEEPSDRYEEGWRDGVEAAAKVAETVRAWERGPMDCAFAIRSLAPPSDSRDQGERHPSVEEGPRPEGPAWGVLHKVADAFEGSVLLHDMNEEEREAVEEAFCLARGVSNAAPPPEAPARCEECQGSGRVWSNDNRPCSRCGGTGTKGGGKP
mgnify:CR=1 FL=1